ncbi:helix-turn-helix domain-containing protein [Streptomyces sp. APSN-46.1]|uniref:helix-turn-helix domain-containing protein n=1 Tax=Streptomyces sp. APSN-46.1 TaxID=2929049 RepID=UPI001FB1E8C4|nr:helix-turn-helix transcriptional regulator [Streptomyces sp. APSN-46.1]MCJ1677579.1 helix-turn-helix domain-containing protein [Streptomyces sp. APSN-46.1]
MPHNTAAGTGARIAAYRRLCRITQAQLATKANISYSLLVKVEQGRRPASSSLIAAVARAMGVPLTTFTGQPYATDHTHDRLDGPLADLRASLDNWDLPLDEIAVRGISEIAADVHLVLDARRASNYAKITAMAPPLIDELVQVSQTATGHTEEQAHRMLVHVYRSAYDVAYNLGLSDLVALLLSRMDYSAGRGSDPYLMALHHYMRAYATFSTGRLEVGQVIISRALTVVDDGVRNGDVPALCSAGNLRLRAAMLACRRGDEDTARGELSEARRLADRLGREVTGAGGDGPHVQSFGPTNVSIHASAVEMELGNHSRALQLAKEVRPPADYFPDRLGHFWIDTARAQLSTGKTDAALSSLLKARSIAPQQAKYHPSVRETVSGLVHAARRTPDTLIGYASWCGANL